MSKLIKKAYDNLQKPGVSESAEIALKQGIEALNCSKNKHSTGPYTGKLIETLDGRGSIYPKALFADLCPRAEKSFRESVFGDVTKINVAAIVSQIFCQEANAITRTKSTFSSKSLPEKLQI